MGLSPIHFDFIEYLALIFLPGAIGFAIGSAVLYFKIFKKIEKSAPPEINEVTRRRKIFEAAVELNILAVVASAFVLPFSFIIVLLIPLLLFSVIFLVVGVLSAFFVGVAVTVIAHLKHVLADPSLTGRGRGVRIFLDTIIFLILIAIILYLEPF